MPPDPPSRPRVSVVMPVKNEAAHLAAAFEAIDAQSYPRELIEVIVVDGGSTDGTLEVAAERAATDPRYRISGGPGVNCPAGMNLGIGLAEGELIAKIDGHGYVNAEFLATAVDYLAGAADVACVGGQIVPISESDQARANALARFSAFGVGGGVYTLAAERHDVESVQCGVYRRAVLDEVRGFDPELQFGEDEELNYRIRQRGWRIVFHPGMHFHYYMRSTLASLFRQYLGYGCARVAVVRKHAAFLRPKHLAPALLIAGLAATLVASLVAASTRPLAALTWGSYAGFLAVASSLLSARARFPAPHRVAGSLVSLHLGYGLGVLGGVWSAVFDRH